MEQTTLLYIRDVYDHAIQIMDTVETYRDMVTGLLDTFLSSMSNRMNQIMNVLTMVATIFIPLTFLAGIYGMNFAYMPELGWRWGYFVVLAFIGMVIIVALWLFSAKRWIGWGQRQARRARLFAVEPEKLVGHLGRVLKRPHK
jgi:magnesium transporter